ncbi:hypothetical protein EV424DRAFT_1352121 [Suillus variegatus]|nr:hypothetical protein EV424DRAFT_1352121 [Suillus variegatus]
MADQLTGNLTSRLLVPGCSYFITFRASISEVPRAVYSVLKQYINATPRDSALRLSTYTRLLKVAINNGELETLRLSRKDVEQWLQEWNISGEERSQFLKSVVDAFIQSAQPQTAAVDTIALVFHLPSLFDYDPLSKLDTVVSTKDHEPFSLLQVFLNRGLPGLHSWLEGHPAVLEKYALDQARLERKILLLSFASLGCAHMGHDLPYSEVGPILQIQLSEAGDRCVRSDSYRSSFSGRLSQTAQSLHVYRSSARTFEREQWEAQEKRLVAWKAGLASVLEVVTNAQERGNSSAVGEVMQQVMQTGESVQVDAT